MNVDITVNGRPWRVALEAAERPGWFQVSVKGRRRVVDASWIDSETLLLMGVDAPLSRVREIGIRRGDSGVLDVDVGAKRFRVTAVAEGKPGSPRRVEAVASGLEGRQSVMAPMPGRIVRVFVSEGDRVTAGQPIVVVEAMKMQNELRSPKDGLVRAVNAKPGDAVEARAVLVEIE